MIHSCSTSIKHLVSYNILPFQMEIENQQLKMTNLKQSEQILLLQDKLQSKPTFFFHSLFSYFFSCLFSLTSELPTSLPQLCWRGPYLHVLQSL